MWSVFTPLPHGLSLSRARTLSVFLSLVLSLFRSVVFWLPGPYAVIGHTVEISLFQLQRLAVEVHEQ